MNRRAARWVFLLSGLLFIPCRAAIMLVQIPESGQQFFALGDVRTRDFDFDHDGRVDIQFSGSSSGFAVRSLHSEAGILTAGMVGANFFGITAVPLLYGELITAYQELPFGASRGITPGQDSGNSNVYLLSFGALDGSAGGVWFDREAYMGFALFEPRVDGEFDKLHYGWLRLREFGGLGAFFYEYAYETEADAPVFAGQVPESSHLLVLGTVCLLGFRRKRKQIENP